VTVAAGRRDLDAVHAGLTRWLRAWRPGADGVRLAPLRKPASGYSSETLFVDVVWTEAGDGHEKEEHLVARFPPAGGGIFPEYDLMRQVRVQSALARTALPVAPPVAVELDDEWAGAPFFLMPAVPGRVLPDSFLAGGELHDAGPAAQARVQREFVDTLADLHRLDWDALGLGDLTPPGARGLAHDVARAAEYAAWAGDGDVPGVLADALEWCRGHRPDPEPPLSLLWGDPRIGNVVYDPAFGQAALLDWEMASIGPAEIDLAWFLGLHALSVEGFGTDLPGFSPEADVIERYANRLGRDVHDYRWFEVFSLVRSDSIFLRIRRMLSAGGLDEPWLRGDTPGQRRIAQLITTT
jgi:aminoglycoside phosphotransferase (APT) family kinase protein